MRSMWVDYIKSSMPYDGNNCECIKDDSCGTSTISSSENSDTLLWGKQSSTSSSSMVHGSTHVSFPSNPNPPVPESSESCPQTSGNYSSHAKHADNISQTHPGVTFLIVAASRGALFYMLRAWRRGYTSAHEATLEQ